MGMKKPSSTAVQTPAPAVTTVAAPAASPAAVVTAPTNDNGTAAAISRLKKKTDDTAAAPAVNKPYQSRDFDKEARGKSLCLLYGHAIGSALIAGTKFEDLQGAFNNMKFFVEAAMKEIFPE